MWNIYFLIALLSVMVASCSQILLKKSTLKQHTSLISEYVNPYVICGYGMLFLSVFLTMLAYKGLSYMSVPIVEGVGYVLVPCLSYLFFKEGFTKRKVLGMVCILAGILLYYS